VPAGARRLREVGGTVIFVTNEVGMGVVPGDALSRRFRDVAGRCNQVMAEGADAVVLMVSGLPLLLKERDSCECAGICDRRNSSPQDGDARLRATARLKQLTMPRWALGRLMDLAVDLAGMTGLLAPPIARKTVVTMAGDHGIARAGVSLYPQEVTLQMVHNFVRGGAGINVLARLAGARVVVVDMGVAGDRRRARQGGKILARRVAAGTRNFAEGRPCLGRRPSSPLWAG